MTPVLKDKGWHKLQTFCKTTGNSSLQTNSDGQQWSKRTFFGVGV